MTKRRPPGISVEVVDSIKDAVAEEGKAGKPDNATVGTVNADATNSSTQNTTVNVYYSGGEEEVEDPDHKAGTEAVADHPLSGPQVRHDAGDRRLQQEDYDGHNRRQEAHSYDNSVGKTGQNLTRDSCVGVAVAIIFGWLIYLRVY